MKYELFIKNSLHQEILTPSYPFTRNSQCKMSEEHKHNSTQLLVSWLGRTDINASQGLSGTGLGPVAQSIEQDEYAHVVLLNNYPAEESVCYEKWLRVAYPNTALDVRQVSLSGPTNYKEIFETALSVLEDITKRHPKASLTFHLSPGTPAMAAVWIILARTRFRARLIESSKDHGVREVDFPFDLSAEFLPDMARQKDAYLEGLSAALPPLEPAFEDIIHRCQAMQRLLYKGRKVSIRSVPVLIEGESGTGKELLARAIHKAGPRGDRPFVAVNCGAIPSELLESELFGHAKGAFTGADKARTGYFEAAHKGTLFLDEIGELPLPAQVKVLRAIQEKEIQRVGETISVKLDIRVMAATNRDLLTEVSLGRFRADLFYRLAVGVLKLPALRNRPGDLSLLMDRLLDNINQENQNDPGFMFKKLSPSARNILLQHSWPGNVRELMNTLHRAVIWSDGQVIDAQDIKEALLPVVNGGQQHDVLNVCLDSEIDLPGIMGMVARKYIQKALENTRGNKTKAAKLLGLNNYQTLNNWMQKYGVVNEE